MHCGVCEMTLFRNIYQMVVYLYYIAAEMVQRDYLQWYVSDVVLACYGTVEMIASVWLKLGFVQSFMK